MEKALGISFLAILYMQVGAKLGQLAEAMIVAANSLLANLRFCFLHRLLMCCWIVMNKFNPRCEFTLEDTGHPSWDRWRFQIFAIYFAIFIRFLLLL